jgi:hypothetical protein
VGLNSAAVQLGSTRRDQALAPDAPWYRKLWHGWQKVARFIGNLLSRIVTTIAFVVLLPFAIGMRLFADPLALRPGPSRWTPLPPPPHSIEEVRGGM